MVLAGISIAAVNKGFSLNSRGTKDHSRGTERAVLLWVS